MNFDFFDYKFYIACVREFILKFDGLLLYSTSVFQRVLISYVQADDKLLVQPKQVLLILLVVDILCWRIICWFDSTVNAKRMHRLMMFFSCPGYHIIPTFYLMVYVL
jgi:hypothetical protein